MWVLAGSVQPLKRLPIST